MSVLRPGTALTCLSGLDHPRDDAHGFKCRKRTLPVHPGALHDHHLRPHFQRPLRQSSAITPERTELALVRFDAAILLLSSAITCLCIGSQIHGHGSYNFHHNCKGVWAIKAGATYQWPGGPSPSALFNVGGPQAILGTSGRRRVKLAIAVQYAIK